MACAKGHPDVLGDDQVIIEIGEHGPVAHTVYRLAKLTSGSLDLLPHRRDHVLAEGRYRRALIARAEVLDTLLHQMRPT